MLKPRLPWAMENCLPRNWCLKGWGPLLWGMQGSQCVGLRRVGGLAARGMVRGLPGELLGQQLTVQAKSPGEALLAAVSFSNAICVCVCVCVYMCVCVCVW